ncbi:VOC family protein [Psychromicrobium xiongbiense]|uniref:VOC family protein n=1 Tax=Psychromicrobium xiongbiense TaxID=3051184 RepID=UPI0025576587|nr:VOC family protein [Psychromicrobium sp. YIM S02556]
MTTRLNPYLNFDGTARDALTYYQGVFGGELTLSTFADIPMGTDPSEDHKIMHGMLLAGPLTVMAADLPRSMPGMELSANGTLSLSGDDEPELRGYWEKLAEGGQITLPLNQAPWGDSFGQLTDQFGVSWMVNIAGSPQIEG